jgi:hypothetical protein
MNLPIYNIIVEDRLLAFGKKGVDIVDIESRELQFKILYRSVVSVKDGAGQYHFTLRYETNSNNSNCQC